MIRHLTVSLIVACSLSQPWLCSNAAIPIVFDFQDSPGEGFFDNSAINDPDVPSATTLGEARRQVMQAAGLHLGSFFEPQFAGETWRIAAKFDPLNGGIAGASPTEWRNGDSFAGGIDDVNFPAVLVNHLAGSEIVGGNVIEAEFDSNTSFDFNTTSPPAGFQESLFSTAVHEIMHGLGFFSDIDDDGSFFDGIPAIFDTFLREGTQPVASMTDQGRLNALVSNNLFFVGPAGVAANPLGAGPVKIHAPTTFEAGSTGSHLDRVAFASTGDLMLPEAPAGFAEQIFLSDLDTAMLSDLGFRLETAATTDANNDGDVDGQDFLALQRDDPATIAAWQNDYPNQPLATSTALVPEPTSLVLTILASAMLVFGSRTRTRLLHCASCSC